MRIATTLIIAVALAPSLVQAQDVDPSGAIRAMTGRHRHHHHWHHHVHIPRTWHHRRHFGIALPPGTSRPGPSRNFIPAR